MLVDIFVGAARVLYSTGGSLGLKLSASVTVLPCSALPLLWQRRTTYQNGAASVLATFRHVRMVYHAQHPHVALAGSLAALVKFEDTKEEAAAGRNESVASKTNSAIPRTSIDVLKSSRMRLMRL